MNKSHKRSILLIKLGALGDLIQAAQTLFELKRQGRNVRLLTSDAWRGCFPKHPEILCKVPFNFVKTGSGDEARQDIEEQLKGVAKSSKIWSILGNENSDDIVVDLDADAASMQITERLGKDRRRIGWENRWEKSSSGRKPWIHNRIQSAYSEIYDFQPAKEIHGTERYRRLLIQAGLLADSPYKRIEPLFDFNAPKKIGNAERRIAVQPMTSSFGKDWPIGKFGALLLRVHERLLAECSTDIFVLGDRNREDQRLGATCLAACLAGTVQISVHNLPAMGASYADQAALLGKCHYFIGGDSSWGHLAAAQGIKTFTIFGEKHNVVVYRPRADFPRNEVVPKRGQKIQGITVESVWGKLRGLSRNSAPC